MPGQTISCQRTISIQKSHAYDYDARTLNYSNRKCSSEQRRVGINWFAMDMCEQKAHKTIIWVLWCPTCALGERPLCIVCFTQMAGKEQTEAGKGSGCSEHDIGPYLGSD